MTRLLHACLLWLTLTVAATAQDLPDFTATSVTDLAGLIGNKDLETLDKALIALHARSGIEGTVVTLPDRARYGGTDGLEPFATRLFNHWGVGDAARNDGFMVLVLQTEQEVRIELGAGYPADADIMARQIVQNVMLPQFRAGEISAGIRDGTLAVIDRIARPQAGEGAQPLQPPAPQPAAPSSAPWAERLLPIGVFGFFGFVIFQILRGQRRKIIPAAFSACPKCGHRGLVRDSFETSDPLLTEGRDGTFTVATTRCPDCGWTDRQVGPPRGANPWAGALGAGSQTRFGSRGTGGSSRAGGGWGGRSGGGSGGFGGGSSRGGGSSGRW